MSRFPDCFPDDVEKQIEKAGGKYQRIENVFRILRYGELDRDAFLCTYEENKRRNVRGVNKPNIHSFSTSCYSQRDAIIERLKVSFKDEPAACIAIGTIDPSCGPASDPSANCHINWWVFKDAHPEDFFRKES